jgi:hypothetical protein
MKDGQVFEKEKENNNNRFKIIKHQKYGKRLFFNILKFFKILKF